jgi:hypothetical protein
MCWTKRLLLRRASRIAGLRSPPLNLLVPLIAITFPVRAIKINFDHLEATKGGSAADHTGARDTRPSKCRNPRNRGGAPFHILSQTPINSPH